MNESDIIKEKKKKVQSYFLQKKEISNGDRRSLMFSKIPPKQLNSERYDSLVSFWSDSVSDISRSNNVLLFTPELLIDLFTVDNVKPIHLPLVLNEMIKLNNILKFEDYNKLEQLNSWSGWFWNKAIKQPFQYYTGSKQILASDDKKLKLLVKDIVEEKAEEFYQKQLEKIKSPIDSIIPIYRLDESFREWLLTKEESELLISILVKQSKAVIIYENQQKKGIKFAIDGEKIQVASETTDIGILKLQITLETLNQQEKKLLLDIGEIDKEIKNSVRLKQKSYALSQLKKKKLLESILEKRSSASHNIHEILLSIDSAASNKQITESLCSGVATLKEINKQLTVEQVENALDDYQNEIANQREIDEAMRSGMDSMSSLDLDNEDDLLKELDQMEKDHFDKEKQEKELQEKLDREKKEREAQERERIERERLGREKFEKEKQERDRIEKEEEERLLLELEELTLASTSKRKDEPELAQ